MQWLLILPLAIPSYITAYSYAGIFDYGGFFEKIFNLKIDIMNHFGLILVLSFSLYPYVYVTTRAFFLNQSKNIIEASKLLGADGSVWDLERVCVAPIVLSISEVKSVVKFVRSEVTVRSSVRHNMCSSQ